ncbi:hypothetical protein SISSUDRAFT_1059593 [Sistotremastrum suecicum HHB10207 ss-3]|uniref:DUF6533 domain-containing protein n=1 Tax=Sistotremastrum suecicum HHB10207 ss-3 TaxID=1314776 RepID=A0A166G295_9AGAM|nr:hypothetical protein SISSUDRAFT_1059593 [Sistotremastrum suecicum HHB10207 ss-3]
MASQGGVPQALLDQLFNAIYNNNQANTNAMAVGALLWWDWFICLDQEVEKIWKSEWSLPKILYLIIRYYGLFDLLVEAMVAATHKVPVEMCAKSPSSLASSYFISDVTTSILNSSPCTSYYLYLLLSPKANDSGPNIISFVANFLLVLRLKVLYFDQPWVIRFIYFVWGSETIIEIVSTTLVTLDWLPIPAIPGITLAGCVASNKDPNLSIVAWVPAMATSAIYFGLTIYKFLQYRRTGTPPPLMMQVLTDGTMFFGMIFAALLVNVVMSLTIKNGLLIIGVQWSKATWSLAAARLVLNLRGAKITREKEPFSNAGAISLVQFRRPPTKASGAGMGGGMGTSLVTGASTTIFEDMPPPAFVAHDGEDEHEMSEVDGTNTRGASEVGENAA